MYSEGSLDIFTQAYLGLARLVTVVTGHLSGRRHSTQRRRREGG